MTEVTEEARAELDAINAARKSVGLDPLIGASADVTMLALDKHHGRTPPDPMVEKAIELLDVKYPPARDGVLDWREQPNFNEFVAALKRMFPDG